MKRVNELGYYNLRFAGLAQKLDITTNQVTALIRVLEIKSDEDCCMRIINTWCYSPEALTKMRAALEERPALEWWQMYRDRNQ